jgi:hypothetical protein
MRTPKTQFLRAVPEPMTTTTFARQARTIVTFHGEAILAEVPRILRRISLLIFVLSISLPVFFVGLLVVLWRLA